MFELSRYKLSFRQLLKRFHHRYTENPHRDITSAIYFAFSKITDERLQHLIKFYLSQVKSVLDSSHLTDFELTQIIRNYSLELKAAITVYQKECRPFNNDEYAYFCLVSKDLLNELDYLKATNDDRSDVPFVIN